MPEAAWSAPNTDVNDIETWMKNLQDGNVNIQDTTGFGEGQYVMRQGDPFQGTHAQMYFVLHGQF